MERGLLEYAANAAWQLPLLAGGGWLLVRAARPGVAAQCRIWTAILLLAALLPLRGAWVNRSEVEVVQSRTAVEAISPDAAVSPANNLNLVSAPGVTAVRAGWWKRAVDEIAGVGTAVLDFAGWVQPVRLSAATAWWLAVAFASVLLLGLWRIAWAWLAVRRLVRRSPEMTLTEAERELVEECARRIGVDVPEMRVSREIAGPVTAGLVHPVLLWPEGQGWLNDTQDEARAALCHEMAHLSRRDYGLNLLCKVAAAGLRWHPATYAVERRIRNAREMACDEQAALAIGSGKDYARSLVRLAASMVVGGNVELAGALGLFNGKALEERVMRLTETRATMSARMRWVRGVAGAAGMLAALGLAGAFYVAPALAQAVPIPPQPPVAVQEAAAQRMVPAAPVSMASASETPAAPKAPSLPALPVASQIPAVPPPPVPPGVARPAVPSAPAVPHAPASPSSLAVPPAPAVPTTPAVHAAVRVRTFVTVHAPVSVHAPATVKLDSPEFRAQIAAAQREAMKAERRIQSKEFQKQMAEAQKQIAAATAKLDSPAFQEQLQRDVQAQFNSQKVREQMAAAQRQIAEATAKLNSPAFRRQIEEAAQAAVKVDSAKIQKQMDKAQKQLSKELQQMQAGRQP